MISDQERPVSHVPDVDKIEVDTPITTVLRQHPLPGAVAHYEEWSKENYSRRTELCGPSERERHSPAQDRRSIHDCFAFRHRPTSARLARLRNYAFIWFRKSARFCKQTKMSTSKPVSSSGSRRRRPVGRPSHTSSF